MTWIESHDSLVGHPKVADLCERMGWDLDTSLGKLHRMWYWCLTYCESGDLRKFKDEQLGKAVDLEGPAASKFVRVMKDVGWFDKKPYFRVHDWWDYVGPFLRSKYKRSPQIWKAIRDAYRPGETDYDENAQPLRNRYVTAYLPDQPIKKYVTAPERTRERLRREQHGGKNGTG